MYFDWSSGEEDMAWFRFKWKMDVNWAHDDQDEGLGQFKVASCCKLI